MTRLRPAPQRAGMDFNPDLHGSVVFHPNRPHPGIHPHFDHLVEADNGIRTNQTSEALAKLRPVFDKHEGDVTVGNSCQITDGAAAKLGLPETKLGILPGAGGTQRLPRLIGPGRAKQMMLFGDFVDAKTALDWGIVNATAAPDALMATTREWASKLLQAAPLSLAHIKWSINVAMDSDLDTGITYEQRASTIVAMSEDRQEGYDAFVNKRPPHFTGR